MERHALDAPTQQYYKRHAARLAECYGGAEEGIAAWFDRAFTRGPSVLDIGAGAGRDLHLLRQAGWDARGVEPCRELIDEALRRYPELEGLLWEDCLPELSTLPDCEYENLLCAAVLTHVPEVHLFPSLIHLRRMLVDWGRVLVSTPTDRRGNPKAGRDGTGRFYNGVSPRQLKTLFGKAGFQCLEEKVEPDSLGRKDRYWSTQLYSKIDRQGHVQP
ncbi:MAG: class I SAM-dependent methyltransferase [Synergistales bacterium]|nr:class I SAM-dependent methyltransferase [Synergistales bacterium]